MSEKRRKKGDLLFMEVELRKSVSSLSGKALSGATSRLRITLGMLELPAPKSFISSQVRRLDAADGRLNEPVFMDMLLSMGFSMRWLLLVGGRLASLPMNDRFERAEDMFEADKEVDDVAETIHSMSKSWPLVNETPDDGIFNP